MPKWVPRFPFHQPRRILAASLGVGALVGAGACLAPTQITLRLTSDVDCDTVRRFGTAIYGGGRDPITTAASCLDAAAKSHTLGSLVITPSGARDEQVTLTAVLGVTRTSESCAGSGYKGCIVSRRRLRFVPHVPLELPVALDRACQDIPCAEDETCAVGRCIPADIDDPRFCSGDACGPSPTTDAGSDGPTTLGGGFVATPPTRVRDTAGAVHGLDDDGEGGIWWTETGDAGSSVSVFSRVGAAPPRTVGGYPGVYAGIDAKTATVYVAASSPLPRLLRYDRATGLPMSDLVVPAEAGIRGVASLAASLVVTLTDGRVFDLKPTELGAGAADLATGYAESDGQRVVWPSPGRVSSFANPAFGVSRVADAGALPASAEPFVGIAVSARGFYVATRSGHIVVVDRRTGEVSELLAAGVLSNVEDLIVIAGATSFDPVDLYIAASDGIWRMTVTEDHPGPRPSPDR